MNHNRITREGSLTGNRRPFPHGRIAGWTMFSATLALLTGAVAPGVSGEAQPQVINYAGDGSDLQQVIDQAPPKAILSSDPKEQVELTTPLVISKALTLKGLNARLPEKLSKTPLIVVEAEGVAIVDTELHGNYDSVPQGERAALLRIHAGNFRVERCKLYDSSKDGVEITPTGTAKKQGADIVGGVIRDIEAHRIGRDAVSISGGNQGLRVRDLTVENISLERGYLRGAVEVSDGTDNISVCNVYAEGCVYAIDVQDHGGRSAPNTNVVIENVCAVRCKHIIRTANSERGHANLTLRNLSGMSCESPVRISNTENVRIENLAILGHSSDALPPISIKNCHGVVVKNAIVQSSKFSDDPVESQKCSAVSFENLIRQDPD